MHETRDGLARHYLRKANRCTACGAPLPASADRQDWCDNCCEFGRPHDDAPLVVTASADAAADRHPADGPILPGHHAGPPLPAELLPPGVRIAAAAETPHVRGDDGYIDMADYARRDELDALARETFVQAAAQHLAYAQTFPPPRYDWRQLAGQAYAAAAAFLAEKEARRG